MKCINLAVALILVGCLPEINLESDFSKPFTQQCVSINEAENGLEIEVASDDGSAALTFDIQQAYDTISEAISIEQSFDLSTDEANLDVTTGINLDLSCTDYALETIPLSSWAAKSGLIRVEILPTSLGSDTVAPQFMVNIDIRNAVLQENTLGETIAIEALNLSNIPLRGILNH